MNTIRQDEREEGQHRRDSALATLEARRRIYVRRGRRGLLTTLLERGIATADDVRALVELPPDVAPVCLGAVPGMLARAGIIEREGYASTRRPDGHARPVSVWRLQDRRAAEQWLAEHPDSEPPPNRKTQRVLPLG